MQVLSLSLITYGRCMVEVVVSRHVTVKRDGKAILVEWYRSFHGTRRSRVQTRNSVGHRTVTLLRFEDCLCAPQRCKCYGYLSSKIE